MSGDRKLDAWVEEAALKLVHQHSLDEIEGQLVASGIGKAEALKLVLLIPSAFAREHFEPQGIGFPDHFLVGGNGRYTERAYGAEPIYASARQLARRWMADSRDSLVARVLDWSAEAKAIKQAKDQGQTPRHLSAVHHGFDA